jgi:hypothetical protein
MVRKINNTVVLNSGLHIAVNIAINIVDRDT